MIDSLFVPVVLILLVGFFASQSSTFLSIRNLEQILISTAGLAIAAAGTTIVIVTGELDLSIGPTAALSGVVAATIANQAPNHVLTAIAAGAAVGLFVGFMNGLVTTMFQVPSFVTTLGASFVLSGVALAMTGGSSVSGVPVSFGNLSNSVFLGVRSIVWIAVLIFLVTHILLHRLTFGLRVFAVGNNREGARLAGIPVDTVRLKAMAVGGAASGIAGVALASRLRSGTPGANADLALTAIAAVVLGGTVLTGGRGSIRRTVAGVVLIGVLKNGLDNLGIEFAYQNVWIGAVFIAAAASQMFRHRFGAGPAVG